MFFQEPLEQLEEILHPLTRPVRHLTIPDPISHQWLVDVLELVLERDLQPEIVVDRHPQTLVETTHLLQNPFRSQRRVEGHEVVNEQLPRDPSTVSPGLGRWQRIV